MTEVEQAVEKLRIDNKLKTIKQIAQVVLRNEEEIEELEVRIKRLKAANQTWKDSDPTSLDIVNELKRYAQF